MFPSLTVTIFMNTIKDSSKNICFCILSSLIMVFSTDRYIHELHQRLNQDQTTLVLRKWCIPLLMLLKLNTNCSELRYAELETKNRHGTCLEMAVITASPLGFFRWLVVLATGESGSVRLLFRLMIGVTGYPSSLLFSNALFCD